MIQNDQPFRAGETTYSIIFCSLPEFNEEEAHFSLIL